MFGDASVKEKNFDRNKLNKVSISDLSRNPYQPREFFNETKLEELTNSIKKSGVIQPIAVRAKKLNQENMKLLLEKEDGLQHKKQVYMKYQSQY